MTTRASNATKRPGEAAKDALRVRRAPRAPEVIQMEKDAKKARKDAKAAAEALKATGEVYVERLDAEEAAAAAANKEKVPRERVRKGTVDSTSPTQI